MTLVIQGILKTQTDLFDVTYYYYLTITDSTDIHFPNTIFRLSNLTMGSFTLIPTLTLFASSQGANALLVVVASTYVHVRRYELKI